MKIFRKLSTNYNNINSKVNRRSNLVQEPDILDIPKKRTSKVSKLKNLFTNELAHLDKKTVQILEKLELPAFIEEAQKVINKTYGISSEHKANIITQDIGKLYALYAMPYNMIIVSPKVNPKNRGIFYSILKHEIRHQKQSFDIFRTEGLGEKWVNYLAENRAQVENHIFEEQYKNMSIENINKLKPNIGEIGFNTVMAYKEALKNGKDKEFLNIIYNNDVKTYQNIFENFRQDILNHYGKISQNSKEAKKTNQYYQQITASKNKLNNFKTIFTTLHEIEALFAQSTGYCEYLFAKYIK